MNGPAVASSGKASRIGRREMASISAVYYTRMDGKDFRRRVSGNKIQRPLTRPQISEIVVRDFYGRAW